MSRSPSSLLGSLSIISQRNSTIHWLRLLGRRGWLIARAVLIIALLSACGSDTPGAVGPVDSSVSGWTDEDIEYQLAVVDEGGFVSTDDPVIDRYAEALDNAEAVCPESRTMLSDIAVRAVQLLNENVPGHSENALSMLQAIHQAASGNEDLGVECTEIAASIIVLIEEG